MANRWIWFSNRQNTLEHFFSKGISYIIRRAPNRDTKAEPTEFRSFYILFSKQFVDLCRKRIRSLPMCLRTFPVLQTSRPCFNCCSIDPLACDIVLKSEEDKNTFFTSHFLSLVRNGLDNIRETEYITPEPK